MIPAQSSGFEKSTLASFEIAAKELRRYLEPESQLDLRDTDMTDILTQTEKESPLTHNLAHPRISGRQCTAPVA